MRSLAQASLTDVGAARISEILKAESGVLARRSRTRTGRLLGGGKDEQAEWEFAREAAECEAEGAVMFWRDEWLVD